MRYFSIKLMDLSLWSLISLDIQILKSKFLPPVFWSIWSIIAKMHCVYTKTEIIDIILTLLEIQDSTSTPTRIRELQETHLYFLAKIASSSNKEVPGTVGHYRGIDAPPLRCELCQRDDVISIFLGVQLRHVYRVILYWSLTPNYFRSFLRSEFWGSGSCGT